MTGVSVAAFASLVWLASSVPVSAHHSFSSQFDANKRITIAGVVSKIELISPHGYVHVEATDPATGKVTTWLFETHAPGQLRRMGLTRDVLRLKVVVDGYASRDGSSFAWGTKYVFEDGRTILTYTPDGNDTRVR